MVVSTGSSSTTHVGSTRGDDFDALRSRIAGQIVTPADESYDTARLTQSLREDRRPLAIVQAVTEQDVASTITFARERGLGLAIRSGGHGLAAGAIADNGIVLDLKQMSHVVVDPVSRTARIQPGATSAVIAAAAHEHGLALTTGDTASVGIGGLATGGGIGYLVRSHGLTIDNIMSARVATADGAIVVASPIEHPDLFWAIRGGGSNFGVVTEFTVRLAPVDNVLGGVLVLPATREILDAYLHHGIAAPDELTTIGNVLLCPPMPFIAPEHVGKRVLAIFVCWTGSLEEGQAALAPLRALAEPIADLIGPMPYPALFQFTDMHTGRHGAHIRSMFADDLSVAALDSVIAAIDDVTSPMSAIQIRPLGGAMGRVDPYATAFPHRDRKVLLSILSAWFDPANDGELEKMWTEQTWAALRGEARGVYVNFLGDEEASRIHDAYDKTTYDRLAQIKRVYDPENFFRHGQNIAPAV